MNDQEPKRSDGREFGMRGAKNPRKLLHRFNPTRQNPLSGGMPASRIQGALYAIRASLTQARLSPHCFGGMHDPRILLPTCKMADTGSPLEPGFSPGSACKWSSNSISTTEQSGSRNNGIGYKLVIWCGLWVCHERVFGVAAKRLNCRASLAIL
jgi:hypothetical protein